MPVAKTLLLMMLLAPLAVLALAQLPVAPSPVRPGPIGQVPGAPAKVAPAKVAQAALPKTWDEVMRGLHQETRRIRNTIETWTLTTEMGKQRQQMVTTRTLNGKLARVRSSLMGKSLLEYGYDGKQAYFVVYPDQVYGLETGKNQAFAAPYQTPNQAEMQDGMFLFQFNGLYDLMIASKPAMRLVIAERVALGGKPARRVVGRATNPKTKGSIEVVLWLAPDKDRLLRAEANGKGKDGPSLTMTLIRTAMNPAATFTASTFRLNPSAIKGFQRVTWPK